MGQLSRTKYANSGQRNHGKALAFMLPADVLELVDAPAASAVAILAATATVAAPVTLTQAAGDLLTGGLAELAARPGGRQITFTTGGATPADAPANAVVTGLDSNGDVATETVALSQTAAAATSLTCWKDITSVAYPAADGTAATVSIGYNDTFGLPSPAKLRGGGVAAIYELEDGAVPTAGTLTDTTNAAPNGGYSPDSTPNGALDFHLAYEVDAAALDL